MEMTGQCNHLTSSATTPPPFQDQTGYLPDSAFRLDYRSACAGKLALEQESVKNGYVSSENRRGKINYNNDADRSWIKKQRKKHDRCFRNKPPKSRGGDIMGGFRKKLEIRKDKVQGAFREQAGKATGNKKLELKGKVQGLAASLKEKIPTIKK
jgi:uncharacterized protein YjbJ (UPF0337 family)